jgi:formylglycine-generating enzyme required for sulfatase activity
VRKGPQGHHEYNLRLLFDNQPMAWNWPVCVNYHEADAYIKWKSMKENKQYRILTEVEHRAIRGPNSTTNNLTDDHVTIANGPDMTKVSSVSVYYVYVCF